MDDQIIRCTNIGVYEHTLTRGKDYEVVDAVEDKYRIVGDHGRRVWISKDYFSTSNESVLIMQNWYFDDDIESNRFVEVTLSFSDGSKRWCNLTTPEKLVEHFNNEFMDPPSIHMKHLIIMKTLNTEVVEQTLKYLDNQNELIDITIPLLES
ncbi:hypothetical protein [Paenibacillus sp. BAC0078]